MKQKMNTYLFGASMITLTFSLNITNVNAATCDSMPSCEQMGYTQTSCENGMGSIKCPFDTSKMKCIEDCSSYTLTGCDSRLGTFVNCGGKCKYISCHPGITLSNGNCDIGQGYNCFRYGEVGDYVTVSSGTYKCSPIHSVEAKHRIYDKVRRLMVPYSISIDTESISSMANATATLSLEGYITQDDAIGNMDGLQRYQRDDPAKPTIEAYTFCKNLNGYIPTLNDILKINALGLWPQGPSFGGSYYLTSSPYSGASTGLLSISGNSTAPAMIRPGNNVGTAGLSLMCLTPYGMN